jgi:hypothetical protein
MGVFTHIFNELSRVIPPDQVRIDATHLKAHRTAASLLKKGVLSVPLAAHVAD